MALFKSIPTLDELRALGNEGVKADVILVDEDIKLDRLKNFVTITVENLTTQEVIKKISSLVRMDLTSIIYMSTSHLLVGLINCGYRANHFVTLSYRCMQ